MRRRDLVTVRSMIARVRATPPTEKPVARPPPIPREPSHDLPTRPRLADHASRFVQLERDVWDRFRPQVRDAVEAALDTFKPASRTFEIHGVSFSCGRQPAFTTALRAWGSANNRSSVTFRKSWYTHTGSLG